MSMTPNLYGCRWACRHLFLGLPSNVRIWNLHQPGTRGAASCWQTAPPPLEGPARQRPACLPQHSPGCAHLRRRDPAFHPSILTLSASRNKYPRDDIALI